VTDDVLLTLPPPQIAPATLLAHLATHWGLTGSLSPLTSERDLNHRLDSLEGRFVIRLTNPAEPKAMTDYQSRAHLHVAEKDPALPIQRLRLLTDGTHSLPLPQGRLRVLTWLDGTPLAHAPRSPAQTRSIGTALARLTAALLDYTHPAADHRLLWDIRQFPALRPHIAAIPDPALRAEAEAFTKDFTTRIAPKLNQLPRQTCHADFNPHNLLVDPAHPDTLTGILDFGDMVRTPRICDLAVAASYHLGTPDPLAHLTAILQGYTAHLPLTPQETALLPDLITARMMTTLIISAWRASLYPDNAAYILRNAPSARAGLQAFRAFGPDTLRHTITRACGQE
jgi:hydroxylysine kinase